MKVDKAIDSLENQLNSFYQTVEKLLKEKDKQIRFLKTHNRCLKEKLDTYTLNNKKEGKDEN